MSDDKPIGVRVQRPYATREEYLDAEADMLGRSHVTLLGTKPRAIGTLLRFEVVLLSGEPVIRAEGRVVGPREMRGETGLHVKLTRIDNRTKAILDEAAQRKAAGSIPARSPSQADTAPPPAPPPAALPIPEEHRSGEEVASAVQGLADLLEPEPEPAPKASSASGPASEPEPTASQPEPETAPEPEPAPAPEPEPAPAPEPEPEAAAASEHAAAAEPERAEIERFPAPDPVPVAAEPQPPSAIAPRVARSEDPVTGPHDRNALLARLRSRLRGDA